MIPKEPLPSQQAEELADAAQSFLEQTIADPEKRFYDVRREMIACALAARMGSYKVEFDRRIGPYGDLIYTTVDPRNVRWCEGYHPHDPRCPWFYEKVRLRTDLIPLMDGWINTDNLRGDSGPSARTSSPGLAGTVQLESTHGPNLVASSEYTWTTVVYLYERNLTVTKKIETGREELEPSDRYMVCGGPGETGCGYRSDTQGQQQQDGTLAKGEQLPTEQPGACPGLEDGTTCGMDLKRIDSVAKEFDDESEHRFTVFAPYESGEDGGPRIFVEPSPWPHETRSVPYVVWDCYVRPFKPMGPSETSINKSYQMGMNLMDRMGMETMMLSRPVWDVPLNRVDYNGERWQFGAEQGLCAYFDPFATAQGSMTLLQAPGLPAAWGQLRSALESDLREDMGINDITFGPGESKDIAVGTVTRLERLGEIPVDDQIASLRREESWGMMATFDIIRATYTEKRLLRMKGKDGSRIFTMFRGADLPNFDIVITTDPNAMQFDAEKVDGLTKIFNPQTPPPLRKMLARALSIPASVVKEYEAEMKQWEAEHPMPGVPPPGGPAPPLPPPIAGRMGPAIPAGIAPPMNGATS